MSLGIGGMGWVTPIGSGVSEVWLRLLDGEVATAESVSSDIGKQSFQVFRVPAAATAEAPVHPRLRRSSMISRFAAIAGLAALDDAGLELDEEAAKRTALILAVSNGGVVYTKRFYHEVVEKGAAAASPLLFPETVFNAPASHLAAILGITGASYTLVGDGAVGVLALKMAEDLMLDPALDRCLVVGSEEVDWLLCDAYRRWRLLRDAPPIEPFQEHPRGMILSEGAGAVVLDRTSGTLIEKTEPGSNFRRQSEAAKRVDEVFQSLGASNQDAVVASANGTFVDNAEAAALQHHCPDAAVYAPKVSLGESVGAGAIWEVICGVQILRTGAIPGQEAQNPDKVIVSTCGMNQQVAGLSLSRSA